MYSFDRVIKNRARNLILLRVLCYFSGIGTVAFDARLGLYQDPAQPEALTLIEEVKNIMTLTHKLMVNPFAGFAMQRGVDTPTFKKYMKCVDTVRKIGQGFVSKKISELKEMNEKKVDLSDDTQGL